MALKSSLLKLLLAEKGSYVSGEDIAAKLHCSRTSIWKAVKQLREEGYRIEAVTNRGYMLSAYSDVLSAEAVAQYFSTGSPVRVCQEISSTNDVLKQLALSEHAPAGTAILSDYQTGGKGRLGRSFYSPKGSGLYLSILLRPAEPVIDSLILTAQSAVAVFRAVQRVSGIALGIKWVNDLYLDGRKVCGILSEGQANFETGMLDFVIVGIGINIYDPEGGFPAEIRDRAGSILGSKAEGKAIDRNRLAAEILREFFELSGRKELAPEYIQHNIVPGHEVMILDGGTERLAYAERILPDGRLLVREADGEEKALVYGEVSIRCAS